MFAVRLGLERAGGQPSKPIVSPPAGEQAAYQLAGAMLGVTPRTLPSNINTWHTPGERHWGRNEVGLLEPLG